MDRSLVQSVFTMVVCMLSNCADPTNLPQDPHDVFVRDPPTTGRAPTVLVVLDGVRWQEVFHGEDERLADGTRRLRSAEELMPNLHALATEHGAALGAPGHGRVTASGPNFVSLPAYNEILSGRPSFACSDNECSRTTAQTLPDELHAFGARVAVFASWEKIALAASNGSRGVLVRAGREGDPAIDPYPGFGDFRPDQLTARLALEHLEAGRPDFLFLGLGEPDEYAHRGDYGGYIGAITAADRVLGELRESLARMGERGAATNIVVTTDHGRAASFRDHGRRYPESARVWVVAAGPSIVARGYVDGPVRHLADVAPSVRLWSGLPRDEVRAAGRPMRELF